MANFQAEQLRDIDVQGMGVRLRANLLAEVRAAMVRARLDPEQITGRQEQLESLLAGANLTNVALR